MGWIMRGRIICAALVALPSACQSVDPPAFEARCVALPRRPSPSIVRLEPVFPTIDIEDAVALVEHPTRDRFYVVSKAGRVVTFTPDDPSPQIVVDLADALMIGGEAGLLDLEVYPDGERVLLSYNAPGGSAMLSRVSTFALREDGTRIDRATEQIVIEVDQPYTNHNGGDIGFGPDGMLYFGLGDGGSAGDPQGSGQDTSTLLGSMLRIDVDDVPPGQSYGIPADNPFAQGGGAPEIFAWGFRNPWRWSFDRETGDLWVGDVGQHRWEEVSRVVSGGNYGWGIKEGPECIGVDTCEGDFIDPVAAYRNPGVASVVGGAVLRGGALPELEGSYVFSDFYDGTIWRLPTEGTAPAMEVIGSDARSIAAWSLARDGTLYGIRYGGGIVRMVTGDPDPEPDAFPVRLSATGCVDVDDPAAPLPWTVPFEVNLPFWSDGADKQRFVAVPEGLTADVDDRGHAQWPVGTVLGKTFWRAELPIETRLLVRDDTGWVGYGYAWDADGRDATLVVDERTDADGWIHPGLRGCPTCHTDDGAPLGTRTAQLDRTIDGGDGVLDQLEHLAALGVLDAPPADVALPQPGDDVPLEVAARAYLDVNCAPCHRDEGTGGRADLDLRREVPLGDTGLCDAPDAGELGLNDARIVVPGDPERSILAARMATRGDARMPPLSSAVQDDAGLATVRAWITALDTCP